MQRRLFTREEVEQALRSAKTKRELDEVVNAYRCVHVLSVVDRLEVEDVAEKEAQRFSVRGEHVMPGRFRYGFQNAMRGR